MQVSRATDVMNIPECGYGGVEFRPSYPATPGKIPPPGRVMGGTGSYEPLRCGSREYPYP